MTEAILSEIRKCHEAIRKINDEKEHAIWQKVIRKILKEIMDVATKVDEKGIGVLREVDSWYPGDGILFKDMLHAIIAGFSPYQIEEVFLYRNCVQNEVGYTALIELLYLVGTLSVQAGECTPIVMSKLVNMCPEEPRGYYSDMVQPEKEICESEGSLLIGPEDGSPLRIVHYPETNSVEVSLTLGRIRKSLR